MAAIVAKTGSERADERKGEDAKQKRFLKRKSWFIVELERQAANRYQMALDEDYYDGLQWTPQEAAAVQARGQNPVVYNEVKPTVDWMIGTERRTRVDFLVTNRSDRSPAAYDDAQRKTKLLKYLHDVNRTGFERSQSADDSFKAGLGWIEVGVRADPTDEQIYTRHESWRHMLYDSLGQRLDCEDWRYQFRFKEVDLDIAEAYFPEKKALLHKAMQEQTRGSYLEWWNGQPIMGMSSSMSTGVPSKWMPYDSEAWTQNPRERVMLIECWANEPFTDTTGRGAGTHDRVRMRKHLTIMTEYDTIEDGWSPYAHDKFPFVPVWCYRRKRDGAPYGIIRQLRGPQDMLNKQMSKAQFRISVNQIRMEKGAIDKEVMDVAEIAEENAAPDGVVILQDGALSQGKFETREGAGLVEADLMLAQHNISSIRQASGITGEQRGLDTNARSGKAIDLKQEQGGMLTTEPFDNQLLARQIEGEITLSLCEQYMTAPKVFNVAGESKRDDYEEINTSAENDITKRKAAFVIGEQPWRQNLAEAAFDSTMELLGQLAPVAPQVVVAILDLVFEMHPNLPKRESILERVRAVTGQNAPGEEDTPEQQHAKAQQQALAQMQFQMQLQQMRAAIAEAQAKGEKLNAEAMAKSLETLYMAAQAAQVLGMAPGITPIADELLKSVGFVDKNAAGQVIDTQSAAPTVPAIPAPQQGDGALAGHMAGIETPAPDGVINQGEVQ
jgi:hypothetical protein